MLRAPGGCGRSVRRPRRRAPSGTSICFRLTIVCRVMPLPPSFLRLAESLLAAIASSVVTVVQLRAVAVAEALRSAIAAQSFERAMPLECHV